MSLGHDGQLYMLAFDHRGSFRKLCGVSDQGDTAAAIATIADAKAVIFEGMERAVERGAPSAAIGILVDEQFGGDVPARAKASGLTLAMPAEKSGQDEFDFEFGEAFGDHIEQFDPEFAKVLVRYNPDGDAAMNARQAERLKRLADWLHARDRRFLFELLVPAEADQLASVDGNQERYDTELRPELMIRAIAQLQDAGVEVDVWKIEGVDTRADADRLARQARADGRDGVVCILLGRGADDAKVDHWLTEAAPVEGFVGFAIGRSIWAVPLRAYLLRAIDRAAAADRIADAYLRFIDVYTRATAT